VCHNQVCWRCARRGYRGRYLPVQVHVRTCCCRECCATLQDALWL
jgi:hypothetical protein